MGILDFLKKDKDSEKNKKLDERAFKTLIEFLEKVPSINKSISIGLQESS